MSTLLTVGIPTIDLTASESSALAELVQRSEVPVPSSDVDAYILECQLLSAKLPSRVRAPLYGLRARGSAAGGILIRNVPLGEIPMTPDRADSGTGPQLLAAKAMSTLVAPLGEQFGFRPELGGQIVQDILPLPGFEDTQQSVSSRTLLELHCETAFTNTRADFVGLLCLRSDPDRTAATLLSPARAIVAGLDDDMTGVLTELRFSTTVDDSFLRGSGVPGPLTVSPIRVLGGTRNHPRIRCDFAQTRGLDAESRAALRTLHEVASEVATPIRLVAGDLLIVDNHGALHGRTPFMMRRDGTDRWLLRTFVARDLARSVTSRPEDGRIVDLDYSALSREADLI